MTISIKTRKLLWGKAANRCSFPDCKMDLVMDGIENDDPSIIGEECHIIARENGGPRGDSSISEEKRDLYNNLILLCCNHHKLVDSQENQFTVEELKKMKNAHEEWVKTSLSIDDEKNQDELVYSDCIDQWSELSNLNNWEAWTSYLLGSGQPKITKDNFERLERLDSWLFSRILPNTHLNLEDSLENFRIVLHDLINTFSKHSIERNGLLWTDKFYRLDEWNPEASERLTEEYEYHVDLVMDLTLELTRAANYVCDEVRKHLLPSFRLKEGLLLVMSGPYSGFSYLKHRVQYTNDQKKGIPYKNINLFKKERINRDFCFGKSE